MQILQGNIFDSSMATLVNTVNCVGVMGAGIALEFKLREPEMFAEYKEICAKNLLIPGKLWIWKKSQNWILNFPTKIDWKHPSRIEYIEQGLDKFVATYRERGITSIAFPLLGTLNGGIDESMSLEIMTSRLEKCDIPIEIYKYDIRKPDRLMILLRTKLAGLNARELASLSEIKLSSASLVLKNLNSMEFMMISHLQEIEGIGATTIAKLYVFAIRSDVCNYSQRNLI